MSDFNNIKRGNPPLTVTPPERKLPEEVISDNEKGISEENLEGLRAEFVSLGGIVDTLPDPSSVRDWTMVGIHTVTDNGEDIIALWLMMKGQWYSLNSYRTTPTGSSGNINQLNTNSEIVIGIVSTIYEINSANELGGTDDWVVTDKNTIDYSDGVFTIIRSGRYLITWSASFYTATNNQEFEVGLLLNGSQTYGWSQRKIGTASDIGSMGASTILDLKSGERISLGVQNITATANFFINHGNLTLNRIR